MGAWDVTAFGNNDAADWPSDLISATNAPEFVERTLALAATDGYLEAPDGSQLVAAAAVVAAALGGAPSGMPEELGDWLRGKETSLTSIAAAARAAIHRVQNDSSELRELWQDSDEFLGGTPIWMLSWLPWAHRAPRSPLLRKRRLNEVALPSAAATDASRVLFSSQVDHRNDSFLYLTEQSSVSVQALCFQVRTIQIP